MQLKANPENEDFKGKYENTGVVARYLVSNYFKSVDRLLDKIDVTSAHEIGVGVGESTSRLKKRLPFLSGSEYVEKNVIEAQKINPELSIYQENVYQLKADDNSKELLLLLEVLEHLDHPVKALTELRRVSSKYLILGVPREPLWRFLNICRFKYIKDLGNTPGHLNHYSRRAITHLVAKYYGEVIAVENPLPWTILLAEKK